VADNVELDAGAGGAVMATDDVGGVHYAIGKLAYGALDSATLAASGAGNVSAGVPRVTLAADDPAVVDLAAIELATEATQAALETAGGLLVNLGANNDVTVTGSVTADLGVNNDVTVTGNVAVTNAGLTELAAAINASSQMDVNLAASNATVTVDLGANNDVTVTGTVDLGAVDNGVLDAIAASVSAIDTDATTIIGHLDGVETLLGTIDADTGGILTAVQIIDNAISGNEMQVDVLTIAAGDNNIGNVDIASAIPAGTNTIGNVVPVPSTSGGLSIFRSLDLDETEEEVKATAGQVYGAWVTNTATATRWIKFYNLTAANTNVGSSTPLITVGMPGNTSDDISAMFGSAHGITFDTAISVAATTAAADADTGAPAAGDVIINVFFK
jgi:hypothetical protein